MMNRAGNLLAALALSLLITAFRPVSAGQSTGPRNAESRGGPPDECWGQQDGTPCTDDGEYCTADYCVDAECQHIPLAGGTPCNDNRECTINDMCDGQGACAGTNLPVGTICSDENPPNICTADECDQNGECAHLCLVGYFCTTPEVPNGQCVQAGDACPCHPLGGCCHNDGSCAESTEIECLGTGGSFRGAETLCMGDSDGDVVDDLCDNCPSDYNPDQDDADSDGYGDFCDTCTGYPDGDDEDGDLIPDHCDNCPQEYNPGQEDSDGDEIGDLCERPIIDCCGDFDGDDIINLIDFSTFAICFGLPAPTPVCPQEPFQCADLNEDQAVDLNDFSTFALRFGRPPDCVPPPDPCLEDVWATDESIPSYDSFADTPIPADFFYPGSPPFTGTIEWWGAPRTIDSRGMTDTVLRRSRGFDFAGDVPSCDTVSIRIVEMNLTSRLPVLVGGVEEWSAYVTLSTSAEQPPGTITACLEHDNGGHFDATYYVRPLYVFVRNYDLELLQQGLIQPEDVSVRYLDTGALGWEAHEMTMTQVPFVRTLEPPLLDEIYYTPGCYGHFIPGVDAPPQGGERGDSMMSRQGDCQPSVGAGRLHRVCVVDCTPDDRCVYEAISPALAGGTCSQSVCELMMRTVTCTRACVLPFDRIELCEPFAMRWIPCGPVIGQPGEDPQWGGFCQRFYARAADECQPCGSTICPGSDADGDRLPDYVETDTGIYVAPQNTGTDPDNPDTDGDDISDGDEVVGTTGGLKLLPFGANPNHKDLFLEVDWCEDCNWGSPDCDTHTHKPPLAQVNRVITAFANAPVANPDGTTGIHLVVDYGQYGANSGGNAFQNCAQSFALDTPVFRNYKQNYFADNRKGYFRYQIHAHQNGQSANYGGTGERPGDDSIVTLGCWVTLQNHLDMIGGTTMHEFGHNLGLHHGGNESKNRKPNYNSVMNYKFDGGVDTDCDALGGDQHVLDYSSGTNIALNENNLNETDGVCGPGYPIDWDCDGTLETGVQRNINCSLWCDENGNTWNCDDSWLNMLHDHDDWTFIIAGGLAPPEGDDFAPPEIVVCNPDSPAGDPAPAEELAD